MTTTDHASELRLTFAKLTERREKLIRRRTTAKRDLHDALQRSDNHRRPDTRRTSELRSELDNVAREINETDDSLTAVVQQIRAATAKH